MQSVDITQSLAILFSPASDSHTYNSCVLDGQSTIIAPQLPLARRGYSTSYDKRDRSASVSDLALVSYSPDACECRIDIDIRLLLL